MTGTLYLVATPIGNLQDITARAVEVLRSVDVVACEDTRHTRKLLDHLSITTRMISYHEHNEGTRAQEIAAMLAEGRSVAIVSDAGTPGICDPSFRAVVLAREAGANVVPIPGPVAFVNAVVASGLPTDAIYFGGFLPARSGERRTKLAEVSRIPATLVFYEAPHRLASSLSDCVQILGPRRAVVARELTKLHEAIIAGDLDSLATRFTENNARGEIVLVIDRARDAIPSPETTDRGSISTRVTELEATGLDAKAALKKAAREFGLSKSEAYRMLKIKG